MTIGRDRAGVAGRQACIGGGIAPVHGIRAFHEARDLGAHHVVTKLQRWVVLFIPVRTRLRQFLQRPDALRGHRMRLVIRISSGRGIKRLFRETLERLVHAFGRLAGGIEKLHPGLVGAFFLLALIRQHGAHDRRLGGCHGCRAGGPRA